MDPLAHHAVRHPLMTHYLLMDSFTINYQPIYPFAAPLAVHLRALRLCAQLHRAAC